MSAKRYQMINVGTDGNGKPLCVNLDKLVAISWETTVDGGEHLYAQFWMDGPHKLSVYVREDRLSPVARDYMSGRF